MDEEQRPAAAEQISEMMRQFADTAGRAVAKFFEDMRPAFEQLAEIASRPEVQAVMRAIEAGQPLPEGLPCHCLCGRVHPDSMGVCDGEGVTTRHFYTPSIGPVDVPLCAPCAVAQGLAEGIPT